MKKKIEDFNAESLVALAKERHQKVMKRAEEREREYKAKVASLAEKEKKLKAEIATAKPLLEKLVEEFEILEREQKEASLVEEERDRLTEADVKSGKATLTQFIAQKNQSETLEPEEEQDEDRDEEATPLTPLEQSASLIREKASDLVRLEFELYETQSAIFSLTTQPVKSLKLSYRELTDMLDYQLEGLSKDGILAQSLSIQKRNEITLIERGLSVMTSGYTWSNLTLKEARRLKLDPILPERLIDLLVEQLSDIEETETCRVAVVYHQPGSYWPGEEIEIRIESE